MTLSRLLHSCWVCLRHRSSRVYLVTDCKSVFKFPFNKLEKCPRFSQNAKKNQIMKQMWNLDFTKSIVVALWPVLLVVAWYIWSFNLVWPVDQIWIFTLTGLLEYVIRVWPSHLHVFWRSLTPSRAIIMSHRLIGCIYILCTKSSIIIFKGGVGLFQGGPSSPVLFMIFMHKISKHSWISRAG